MSGAEPGDAVACAFAGFVSAFELFDGACALSRASSSALLGVCASICFSAIPRCMKYPPAIRTIASVAATNGHFARGAGWLAALAVVAAAGRPARSTARVKRRPGLSKRLEVRAAPLAAANSGCVTVAANAPFLAERQSAHSFAPGTLMFPQIRQFMAMRGLSRVDRVSI